MKRRRQGHSGGAKRGAIWNVERSSCACMKEARSAPPSSLEPPRRLIRQTPGRLLGSVSQQCAQHAFCLVVSVRGTAKNEHEEVSWMEYGMILLCVVAGLALAAHRSQKLFGCFGGSGPTGARKFFAGLGFRTSRWRRGASTVRTLQRCPMACHRLWR